MQSSDFVEAMFRSYYRDASFSVYSPYMIEKREFGFVQFKRGMIRHRSFKDEDELRQFLLTSFPSDAYYSCAYYDDPEAVMERKGWLGADLIFDIDADHIPTSCSKIHDEWTCEKCQMKGIGVAPEKCPVCGGEKFATKTWPCEECLGSAKFETVKLLDMLRRDFGFAEKELHVFFSGHRGYHVHVENAAANDLDSMARKEIVDYVIGLGLEVGFQDRHGRLQDNEDLQNPPNLGDLGWRGRLTAKMYDFILEANVNDLVEIGVKKKTAETIVQNRKDILQKWKTIGPYHAVKGVGLETWKKVAELCANSSAASIDTVVTTDVHRLIRLTGTLHGKTGLKKVEFPASEIAGFDPFKSAVAFNGGTATVYVSDAPQFRLGEQTFGPFKKCTAELPIAAALLLVCKDRAEIVG